MQERGNLASEYSHNAGQRIGYYSFGVGLIASLIWHLFWIFSVVMFITPTALNKGLFSNVTFLGAILDERAIFVYKDEESDEIANRQEFRRPPLSKAPYIFSEPDMKVNYIAGPILKSELREKDFKLASKDELIGIKQTPLKPFDKIRVSYKAYPLQIKGPVRFREVVYKPELPSHLKWDEELGVDLDRLGDSFDIELKFWVSPEGKVELVERISSSGHPTVDLVGIRYLKGWQFAPLAAGKSSEGSASGGKEEQWGIVKLNFSLLKEAKTR